MLKPNDDYGGHGVFFGPQLDERAWDAAIATALSADYVVQEAIDLSRRSFQSLTRPSGNFSRCSLIRTHFSFAEKSAARWFAYPPRQSSTSPPKAVRQASLFYSEYAAQRFSNTTAHLKGDNGFAFPFKGRG